METAPQDFSRLQKLLALKRHEQPPPGYFDRLPGQISARIKAESAAPAESWWQQFLVGLRTKPAWSLSFSVLVLGALAIGVLTAVRLPTDNAGTPSAEPTIATTVGADANSANSANNDVALKLPLDFATNAPTAVAPPGLFSPSGRVDRVNFR